MQDQNNLNQNTSSVQQITDVPPMPDFVAPTPPPTSPTTDPNYFPPNGNTTSNKKFGKGKIIATFLGILLLVAGVTTGIILVLQPQSLQQEAATTSYGFCPNSACDTPGFSCTQDNGQCLNISSDPQKQVCECVYPQPPQIPPPPPECFLPGTKILTPSGKKNIEDLNLSEQITSFDTNTEVVKTSKVTSVIKSQSNNYYVLKTVSGSVNVTEKHPFYIGQGKYKEAAKLYPGEFVYTINNNNLVPDIVISIIKINQKVSVYNLSVSSEHTFFANNYAVHNKNSQSEAVCSSDVYCSNYKLINGISCYNAAGTLQSCCPGGYTPNTQLTICNSKPGNGEKCTYDPNNVNVCAPGYICSISGKCAPETGTGNCKNNTGNCFVDTAIGLEDLNGGQDGPYGATCQAGGHWTTCAQGYSCSVNSAGLRDCIPQNVPNPTNPPNPNPPPNPPQPTRSPLPSPSPTPTRSPSPTPVPQCNSICTTSLNCPSGMICSTGFCRNPSCTSQTNCLCPTPSPSPTPTRSPSPTPSPTPVPQCNSICAANSQCPSGLVCSIATGATSGNCRNPSCTSQTNCLCPTPTPSPIPSPTPGPTAICSSVKAYDTAWTLLSSTDLSNLRAGNNIQFCVAGTTTGESFDMARFTINGTLQANTTTKRPTSNDFCQAYTIPANVYTFEVTAEIHHTSLGWVGP